MNRGADWDPEEHAAAELFAQLAPRAVSLPRLGDRIDGRYELIERIGQGGMGVVFRARDTRLKRTTALKLLTASSPASPRPTLAPGVAEGALLARLDHPHIVAVHDAGVWRGLPWLVMALVDGEPLDAALRHGPLGLELALEVAEQLASALAHAHRHGVLHRDVKPGNVMLCADGARLLDFGVAFEEGDGGGCAGTPAYAAPEQWDPEARLDPRVDVHGLGALLFEVLCEVTPFGGEVGGGREPPPFELLEEEPGVPLALVGLIRRCLDPDPEGRPPDAVALQIELEALRRDLQVDPPDDCTPYRYLAPFAEEHARWFHGRGAAVSALERAVRGAPLWVLTGPSGAGKSSLIAAGLVPRLRGSRRAWDVAIMTPGRDPWQRLCQALGASDPAADLRELALSRARRGGGRLLIVVDQFEELYTQDVEPADQARFWSALARLGDDVRSPLRLLLAVRSDFLAHADLPAALRGALLRAAQLVERPSPAGLRAALTRPARALGVDFEAGLAEAIVAELATDPTPLPLLQLVASELWARRPTAARTLTQAHLRALGGIDGLFSRHADHAIDTLPAAQRPVARAMLCDLVTDVGTRRRRPRAELLDRVDAQMGPQVLAHLIAGHLVSSGRDGVSLAHEALIDRWARLRRWLAHVPEEQRRLAALTDAAQAWDRVGRPAGLLWRGRELDAAEGLRTRRLGGSSTVDAFLAGALRRRRRRRRLWGGAFALALIGGVAFIAYVLHANRQLRREQAAAELALAQGAAARGALPEAWGHLLTSVERGDSLGARALWWRLGRLPARWAVSVGGIGYGAALAHGGEFAVAVGQDRTVYVIDVATARPHPLRSAHPTGQLFAVAVSPDDRRLLVGGGQGAVRSWSRTARGWVEDAPRSLSRATVRSVAISPDGAWHAAADIQGRIAIWAAGGGPPRILRGATGVPVRGLTVTATEVLAASSDGAVIGVHLETGEERPVLAPSGRGLVAEGHQHQATVGFDEAGDRVALAFKSGTYGVEEVNLRTGLRRTVVSGLAHPVVLTAFLPERGPIGGAAASGIGVSTLDGRYEVYGPTGIRPAFHVDGGVRGVDFRIEPSSGALTWFTVAGDRSARLHTEPQRPDRAPLGPPGARYDVRFATDGAWFAFGGHGGPAAAVRRRRVGDGSRLPPVPLEPMRISMLALSPSGAWLAAGGRPDRLQLRAPGQGRSLSIDDAGDFGAVLFLDDETVLAGTGDGWLRVHDLAGDRALAWIDLRSAGPARGSQVDAVGALVSLDAETVVAQQAEVLTALSLPADGLAAVRARPLTRREALPWAPVLWRRSLGRPKARTLTAADGALFISDVDQGIVRFAPPDLQPAPWGAPAPLALGLAALPGGEGVVAAHRDGSVRLHRVTHHEILGHHVSEANAVAVSPDGTMALSAGDDDTLRAWDLSSGRAAWRAPLFLPGPARYLDHRGWNPLTPGPDGPWTSLGQLHHAEVEAAALDAAGARLCLHRPGRLEVYVRGRRVQQVPTVGPVPAPRSAQGACAFQVEDAVEIVTTRGVARRGQRRLLGDDGRRLALLGGAGAARWIERAGPAETWWPVRVVAADEQPTAFGLVAGWQVTGFAQGDLEIRRGDVVRSLPRKGRAPTTHLRAGPAGTLLTGDADGWVELWDLTTPISLHAARLDGGVEHLHVEGTAVVAISELGDALRWVLDPLVTPYEVLRAGGRQRTQRR